MRKKLAFLLAALLCFSLFAGCAAPAQTTGPAQDEILLTQPAFEEVETAAAEPEETEPYLDPYGSYTTKEDVALRPDTWCRRC